MQDMMFEGRRAAVNLHTPDFAMLAQSMAMPSFSVASRTSSRRRSRPRSRRRAQPDRRRHHRVRADADRAAESVDDAAAASAESETVERRVVGVDREAQRPQRARDARVVGGGQHELDQLARFVPRGQCRPRLVGDVDARPSARRSSPAPRARSSVKASLSRQCAKVGQLFSGDPALDCHRAVRDPLVSGAGELGDAHDDQLAQGT